MDAHHQHPKSRARKEDQESRHIDLRMDERTCNTRHRAAPASNHLDPHLPEPEYYRCISPHMEEYVARTTADALWSAKYTSIRNPRWMSVATRSREALRYLSRQVGRAVTLGFRTRSIYSCGFPMNSCRNHSLDLGRRRVRAKSHDCI